MTQAIKVKNFLTKSLINSNVIKLDSNLTKKGCSYGVEFDCGSIYTVESLLTGSSIKYNQILNI